MPGSPPSQSWSGIFLKANLLEVTLIENIQREDLSAIETANAFHRMSTGFHHWSADEIGHRHNGKDRSTVINFLRLLGLPQDLQDLVSEGKTHRWPRPLPPQTPQ